MPVSRQLLKPVSLRFIVFTFIVGLTLQSIPWGITVRNFMPDFVALVLLYWCMNQPRHVGVGWAFWLGIMLDIVDRNVFGQHSLAYCLTSWLVLSRHRQLAMFPIWQQSVYIGPLLMINQLIMMLVRLVIDHVFPGWLFFVGSIVGALLWPGMCRLLLIPQRTEKPAEIES